MVPCFLVLTVSLYACFLFVLFIVIPSVCFVTICTNIFLLYDDLGTRVSGQFSPGKSREFLFTTYNHVSEPRQIYNFFEFPSTPAINSLTLREPLYVLNGFQVNLRKGQSRQERGYRRLHCFQTVTSVLFEVGKRKGFRTTRYTGPLVENRHR